MTAGLSAPSIRPRLLWLAAVVLFILDRALKTLVMSRPAVPFSSPVAFALFKNTGIAFSIPIAKNVFWLFAVVALAALVIAFSSALRKNPPLAALLIFALLGSASNLIDRLVYGATIDYVIFFGRSAVNLADAMILFGLVSYALALRKPRPRAIT